MKMMTYGLCLIALLAIAIAGCGGGDGTSEGNSGSRYGGKPASTAEPSPTIAVISTRNVGDLGTILVDSDGRTLYDFHKDKSTRYLATSSACYGACAEAWPPLLTGGQPEPGSGALPTKLGVLKRKDGTLQVTYFGHPLYTYAGDKAPGEANGNDIDQFGAEWYALQPNGEEPED